MEVGTSIQIRADSPVLGFHCSTRDPLRYPSPDFPRDLCDSKTILPALQERELRTRASALSLNHTRSRNAVYLDPTDASLLFHPHSSSVSLESIASESEDEDDEDRQAAYLYIRALYSPRQSSQVYLGPSQPSQPTSSRWSTTSSLVSPPLSPVSNPSSDRDRPSKRKRLTSLLSRFSRASLLSPPPPSEPRAMREAYLERDDPPAPVGLVLGHTHSRERRPTLHLALSPPSPPITESLTEPYIELPGATPDPSLGDLTFRTPSPIDLDITPPPSASSLATTFSLIPSPISSPPLSASSLATTFSCTPNSTIAPSVSFSQASDSTYDKRARLHRDLLPEDRDRHALRAQRGSPSSSTPSSPTFPSTPSSSNPEIGGGRGSKRWSQTKPKLMSSPSSPSLRSPSSFYSPSSLYAPSSPSLYTPSSYSSGHPSELLTLSGGGSTGGGRSMRWAGRRKTFTTDPDAEAVFGAFGLGIQDAYDARTLRSSAVSNRSVGSGASRRSKGSAPPAATPILVDENKEEKKETKSRRSTGLKALGTRFGFRSRSRSAAPSPSSSSPPLPSISSPPLPSTSSPPPPVPPLDSKPTPTISEPAPKTPKKSTQPSRLTVILAGRSVEVILPPSPVGPPPVPPPKDVYPHRSSTLTAPATSRFHVRTSVSTIPADFSLGAEFRGKEEREKEERERGKEEREEYLIARGGGLDERGRVIVHPQEGESELAYMRGSREVTVL
ncbi:hypothetical protein C0991_009444 [Blastosporella zonata]|nr:hypothetical protein C0991_009444 [Blastosporella zonata]